MVPLAWVEVLWPELETTAVQIFSVLLLQKHFIDQIYRDLGQIRNILVESMPCVLAGGRVWHFGFETSRFRNFSNYFDGIGIGFEIFWYRKKYRYWFRKILVSKKVSVSVSKKFGIEKSIGIGFEKLWYRKKYRYRFRKKIGIEKNLNQFQQNLVQKILE